ncbi:hypothetical protein EV121DRAFT_296481 [Schizophyllum commune]
MPLMPTCMIFDHEEEIPGFVNGCCLVCGKPVKTKRAQKSHSRTFHLRQDVWSNVVETRPFPCPDCPYRAAQDITLRSHIWAKHTHEKPYVCKVCGHATANAGGMTRHRQKHGKTTERIYEEDDTSEREQPAAGHAGPSRATRSAKRYTPYTKQAARKPKATKKATSSENYAEESPRPLSPTYEAQPVQQKDVYYEVHPSQYEQNQYCNTPANSYPPTAPANSYNTNAPTNSYYPQATPVYPPVPLPTYNAPAPACNQQTPVYPPAAYCNNNYAPATAPNTTYASSSSFNQASSSSSSSYIAEDSSVPQLTASDIKFAGISFPAGANQQVIAYEVLPAAHVDAYPAAQTDAFPAIQIDAFSAAAELEVSASWYYAQESSPYNAQESCPYNTSSSPNDTSPYNTSSPLENLTLDATASSPEEYGFPATPTAPAALNFAQEPLIAQTKQQSFVDLAQQPLLDVVAQQQFLDLAQQQSLLDLAQQQSLLDLAHQKSSPEPMIDFSQDSMLDLSLDFSQQSTFDFSMLDSTQQPYIDFSQLELDFSKMGGLEFSNMGDLDPDFGNYSPESNAPYTSSASYSSPQSNPPPTKEELGWLFDEFIVAGPMATRMQSDSLLGTRSV